MRAVAECPWFWIGSFALFAALFLGLTTERIETKQEQRWKAYQGRVHSYAQQLQAQQGKGDAESAEEAGLIPSEQPGNWPIWTALAVVAIISLFGGWRDIPRRMARFRAARDRQHARRTHGA